MKSGLFPGNRYRGVLLVCLLACMVGQAVAFEDGESGWEPRNFQAAEPWRELDSELPAYPLEKNLIDTGVSKSGGPYRIYLDTQSLSVAEDGVVRYTVVIVSDDGIWNVTHEGLHCGKNMYRRYAYGMNGDWQELPDSPWLPLKGVGINAYRKTFYVDYMCNPYGAYMQPDEIIRKFRSRRMVIDE
jgi:hypothetical protein